MSGPLIAILLVVMGTLGVYCLRAYRRHKLQEQLRKHVPERAYIEVKLPAKTADANIKAQSFFRKVASLCEATSSEEYRTSARTISHIYHAKINKGQQQPEMRCYIGAESDLLDQIKRMLKNEFRGDIQILPVPEGPTMHMVKQLIAQAEAEEAADEPDWTGDEADEPVAQGVEHG